MNRSKFFIGSVIFCLLAIMLFSFSGCEGATTTPAAEEPVAEEPAGEEPVAEEPAAEEPVAEEPAGEAPAAVKFGHTGPVTGPLATAEIICQSMYNLYTEQVNEQGGIPLTDFNVNVPLNWTVYNDMGDTGRASTNIEKLITQDNVDIIYGSYGTFQGFAQEPLVNDLAAQGHNTVYMVGNGTCVMWETAEEFFEIYESGEVLTDEQGRPWNEWEYTIWTEMPRAFHIEGLVNVLVEAGVETVVVWEIGTLYGAESSRFLEYYLPMVGIEMLAKEQYPVDILDFTPLITKAKALNPDAIIQFSYPDDGMKSIEDMIAMDYNPKLFYDSLGVTTADAYTRFGSNLDGILYQSFAYPKSPKSVGTFGTGLEVMNTYLEKYGQPTDMVDGAIAYSTIEVMGELIKRAGSTDKDAIYAEILNTKDNPIPTLMGPVAWDIGPWTDMPGAVGQHIGTTEASLGEDCEIVGVGFGEMGGIERDWDPAEWISADVLYPKPEWK